MFMASSKQLSSRCKQCYKFAFISKRCYSSQIAQHEPLRILFCGSDEFSEYSLQALHKERKIRPDNVESIDVLYRPAKPTGRGLKILKHTQIETAATDLGLPRHEVDNFREWKLPSYINLVIAVSFGLMIPRRVLEAARYGGLNVHPSLLPDLRGAAPLQYTLLYKRRYMGVTVQTLHPSKFDHGKILTQTPPFDYSTPAQATVKSLTKTLGPLGADLLIETIRERKFLPEAEQAVALNDAQLETVTAGDTVRLAPKIQSADRKIQWDRHGADSIVLRQDVLGALWDESIVPKLFEIENKLEPAKQRKRVVFDNLELFEPAESDLPELKETGIIIRDDALIMRSLDDKAILSRSCTLDGGDKGKGVRDITKLLRKARSRPAQGNV